ADAHAVELVEASNAGSSSDSITQEQTTPLLVPSEKPKIDIFSVSYSRQRPIREQVKRQAETETSPFTQLFMWAWSGSSYSGLLCMALSSTIYCTMEVISDIFSVQSIPLFEKASIRCTIILILSFLWLRRSRQPIFGPVKVRSLLVLRALLGYISLLSFIYCIERLPLSQAIVWSFTAPIMASLAARIFFHEKFKITEIGGLACSFFGVLFIFWPFTTQGWLAKTAQANDSHIQDSHHIYAVLVGLLSSITAGISYCLIRAGAKSSQQPVVTIFSFGLLASPALMICMFTLENVVLPGLYSLVLMVFIGILAFFAELFLTRGLQLEKTSKVVNILYTEAALSQLWGLGSSRIAPSFGRLIGCFLILISACSTVYIGPEKDGE
ncbi:hypothetical protein NMG60_11035378, partial [Bertholletia excelsa]